MIASSNNGLLTILVPSKMSPTINSNNTAPRAILPRNGGELSINFLDVSNILNSDSLQQLSTNALPPYVPVPPPVGKKSSFKVNSCQDCGDSFALKSSLKFHLERRSVMIKFPCETCKSSFVFYNRCSLLSHIRNHTDNKEKADIKLATVLPLPRVMMEGLQTEFANSLDDEMQTVDSAVPTELLEFSLKETNEDISPVAKPDPPLKSTRVKCLDCNQEFESALTRKKHLTNDDKIPLITSQCATCGMVCPSKCHLKAHQRLHLQVSPYICPECGESPDYYWVNFQHHVKYKCFHFTRSIGYKCPACKRVTPSEDALLKHMELHTEKYMKCSLCVRAYTTMDRFQEHVLEHHPNFEGQVTVTTIYKCYICDILLRTREELLSHRDIHTKNRVCEYVFNCMQCGKSFANKMVLLEHIKSSHAKLYRFTMQKEPENKPAQSSNAFRGKIECILCNCIFHSFQGYIVHINRAHINVNHSCKCCYMIIGNRKDMVLHGIKHQKKGQVICLLCDNKTCDCKVNLDLHLKYHVDKLQGCSACPVCNELLPTKKDALEHLRKEHLLAIGNDTVSQESSSSKAQVEVETINCHLCKDSFGKDEDLQEHLRTNHSFKRAKQPINLAAFQETEDLTEMLPAKRRCLEIDSCAKCDFRSEDRASFREHLATHKTNKSTYQCMECGLCYVVEPALVKHLRIAHKITNGKKYIDEEGCNFTPDVAKEKEVFSCDSLVCNVCFKTFTTETALKTHMRSHGMAFIRANKSNAAT